MSSLSDFLTKIANSIRKVKGTNAQINAQNFSTEIEKMKIGGSNGLQWKCDNMKTLYNEFNNYQGTSLDEALTGLDTSKVTNMGYMFSDCSNLTSIPQLDTSNVTNMGSMFQNCSNLTSIPQLNTSNVTYTGYMFRSCNGLTTIPSLDTSNVTGMDYMFQNCSNLTSIPQLNTSNVTNMRQMFRSCNGLTTIPSLNTSKVNDMHQTFDDCDNLTTIGVLDLSNVEIFGMNNCKKITNITFLNIKINLQVGSGTSWGHLLTLDSLIGLCKECIKQSSSKTLTVGSANMEKLANVYVKFTDSAQTTIDIGAKGDVVQCESTDEGAMAISQYMGLKNWKLA